MGLIKFRGQPLIIPQHQHTLIIRLKPQFTLGLCLECKGTNLKLLYKLPSNLKLVCKPHLAGTPGGLKQFQTSVGYCFPVYKLSL